jgi:hypothetical protein
MNSQIKPGRRSDALAVCQEAVKLLERHGDTKPRVLLTSAAGELLDTISFSIEFPSLAEYGTFSDAIARDDELQAYQDRLGSPNSPLTPQAILVTAHIPGPRPPRDARGEIVEVYFLRARPGGADALISIAHRWHELVESHGAINTHLLTVVHGGSITGCTISVTEWSSNEAWGRGTEAYLASTEGQKLTAEFAAASGPGDVLMSGLYTQIPL